MSKHQEELVVPFPPDEVLGACERAAGALGWRVADKHAGGLTCAQIAPTPMAMGNPVTVEVTLAETREGGTRLRLKGRNFGFGPFQSSYVKQRMSEFAAAVE